jgi:hypothetical protein
MQEEIQSTYYFYSFILQFNINDWFLKYFWYDICMEYAVRLWTNGFC